MIEGHAKIRVGEESFDLSPDETLLIPSGMDFYFDPCNDAFALTTLMDPTNKVRASL